MTERLKKYGMGLVGAVNSYKVEWEWDRLLVGDKMFLSFANLLGSRPAMTFKAKPADGLLVREEHKDVIIPGYYMNKEHWNTAFLDKDLDEEMLKKCIEESYKLVLSSLSKKRQKEIIG